jgi:hypothetical protein
MINASGWNKPSAPRDESTRHSAEPGVPGPGQPEARMMYAVDRLHRDNLISQREARAMLGLPTPRRWRWTRVRVWLLFVVVCAMLHTGVVVPLIGTGAILLTVPQKRSARRR